MEKRLLLAFLLMGLVLFLTPYFYKPQPPPTAPTQPAAEPAPAPTQPEAVAPAKPPVEVPETSERIAAESEETYTLESDLYKIVFSNRGAVVKSWILKEFVDSSGDPLELVNEGAVEKVGYPFQIEVAGASPSVDPNTSLYSARVAEDGLGIRFELSDGRAYFSKAFHLLRHSYLADVTSEAAQDGHGLPHFLVWRGGFGDASVPNAPRHQHTLYFDQAANKLIVNDAGDAEDGPVTHQGNFSFAGIEDAYFAAVALPRDGASFQIRTFSDPVHTAQTEQERPHVGAAIGGEPRNSFPLFVGPKDLDLLKQLDPKLQQIVDFGWFSFLAKPLFLVLKWVNNKWISNYGWAIVVVTIAINVLLFPLKFTSLKSMKKMQALQPEVQAINEKYKGLSIRDPRKSQQNQELMELYKKHGVNPMGGCMPMILQIPFFFAFYKVLTVAIELRGADWLWVTDLSQPEHLPIRVLPVVMVASQFVMQKMTPATTGNPSQQRMMMFMPLMMGFFFYGVSSGLVLYWLTSNVVGVAQQLIINRLGKAPEVPAVATAERKPRRKRSRK